MPPRHVAALLALLPLHAHAQTAEPATPPTPGLLATGTAPVNAGGNPGLAPTYFGRATFDVPGLLRSPAGHLNLTGTTRGWADGTCILSVNANPGSGGGANGCGQGGFWDPWYRTVYPGQDSDAVSFGIGGIKPVAIDAPAATFGATTLTNFAGQEQVVGTVTLDPPLSAAQVAAINAAAGPMRVQVSNGYFGYTVPAGLTQRGAPVAAASADGRTLLVDNFTRAVVPGNAAAPGTPGGTAALPTLPYLAEPGNGGGAGSGIFPDRVGMTNGSPRLPRYTVTIDGNELAEVMYLNAGAGPDDIVNNLRISEEGIGNNKAGTSIWNDLQPLDDRLDGKPFAIQMHYATCITDSGRGNGTCGSYAHLGSGIKRGLVLDNRQVNRDEGPTEGVLDIASTIGWKSVKTSGYVLWIDPGNTGEPLLVMDSHGTVNARNRLFVGTDAGGATVNPDGTLVPGNSTLSSAPSCGPSNLGAHFVIRDGRKPGEAAGNGSGVPADCLPPRKGARPAWISVYDHAPVQG